MHLDERIESFVWLGDFLGKYLLHVNSSDPSSDNNIAGLEKAVLDSEAQNQWFIADYINYALHEISRSLSRKNLTRWLSAYPENLLNQKPGRRIGTILAGNIPMVGFHDILAILISGNRLEAKLSSKDKELLPFITELLIGHNPAWKKMIRFHDERLGPIDAIIATGSNNTFRYFQYYFGKYPHIFRKNRNGVAILIGDENPDELKKLTDDIFLYFGLGCRSVSKILIPEDYSLPEFIESIDNFSWLKDHNKYSNNYNYFRSVYLLNKIPHLDNGFLLLKEDNRIQSPVANLYYEHYGNYNQIINYFDRNKEDIQCLVGTDIPGIETIAFGTTQKPNLWDYADGADTLNFLLNLCKN